MDWTAVRDQFPVTKNYIYLDLANKCPLPLFSTKTIEDYIRDQQTTGGDKAKWFRTISEARERFAKFVNASPDEIAILKNTSEGLNIAANGIPFRPRDSVVLNEAEHPNNIYCWLNLRNKGVEVRWFKTRNGQVQVEDIAAVADSSTRAVAVALVNYAPGNRNDIKAISRFCRERRIYSVVDAVQGTGTLKIDVEDLGMDIMATGGHKALFVPHGIGILYCRKDVIAEISPVYVARSGMSMAAAIEHDSPSYELSIAPTCSRFEIGNNNYLGITVLNENLRYIMAIGIGQIERRILDLSGYLQEKLLQAGARVLSPREESKRSAIICFTAGDVGQLHKHLLEKRIITTLRRDSIRVSVGIYNSEEEIDTLAAAVEQFLAVPCRDAAQVS
jgi:selenocysteine lyase/cysteine desulfurase